MLPWIGAPTRAVSPETATDAPNASLGTPSSAASCCSRVHVVPERTKTYAAPAFASAEGAPTMTVSPESATAPPNASGGPPSAVTPLVSTCCRLHVVPESA